MEYTMSRWQIVLAVVPAVVLGITWWGDSTLAVYLVGVEIMFLVIYHEEGIPADIYRVAFIYTPLSLVGMGALALVGEYSPAVVLHYFYGAGLMVFVGWIGWFVKKHNRHFPPTH